MNGLSTVHPDEDLSWDEDNAEMVAEFVAVLAKLTSPKAFVQILKHIFAEFNQAMSNGHKIGYEHHDLKHAKVHGVLDHHIDDELSPGHERYWGLFCATLMSAIGAYLQVYKNLVDEVEPNADFDQRSAIELMHISQESESTIELLTEIMTWLGQNTPKLFAEEFALFCQGQQPKSIEQALFDANTVARDSGKKEFHQPQFDVQVWLSPDPQLAPIVMIQSDFGLLPTVNGEWNHMAAQLVKQALVTHGLEQFHETGVATIVVHSDRDQSITEKMRSQSNYHQWQSQKPMRLVAGISAVNNEFWFNQYDQCEIAIRTQEKIAEILGQTYEIAPQRNLLAATKSVLEGAVNGVTKNNGPKQLAFLQIIRDIEALGYQRVEVPQLETEYA